MTAISFTIQGEPASKANSRRIVKHGKKVRSIKSEKALGYEHTARLQIPNTARQMLEGPLKATITIYYASYRPDLDESVILDVMQARYSGTKKNRKLVQHGVYVNDRQVKEKHIYHGVDTKNPRAEITIEHIG